MAPARVAAIVLAGGRARRLGGADKPALVVGGRSLLDTVLAAGAGLDPVVVVGPERPTARPVRWTREDPPHAGPVAAVAAGTRALAAAADPLVSNTGPPAGPPADPPTGPPTGPPALIVVLAADLPGITAGTVGRLVAAVEAHADAGDAGRTGAVLVDADGRTQWLCGVWRAGALAAAVERAAPDAAVRRVLGPLDPVEVAALPGEADDVDTTADLDAWRRA